MRHGSRLDYAAETEPLMLGYYYCFLEVHLVLFLLGLIAACFFCFFISSSLVLLHPSSGASVSLALSLGVASFVQQFVTSYSSRACRHLLRYWCVGLMAKG